MAKGKKYYGVAKGRTVAVFRKQFAFPIFLTDDDRSLFEKSTKDYPGALWAVFETQKEAAKYVKKFKDTKSTSVVKPAASGASTLTNTSSEASAKPIPKKQASTQELTIKGPSKQPDETDSPPPSGTIEETKDDPIKISRTRQKSVQLKPSSEPPLGVFLDRKVNLYVGLT